MPCVVSVPSALAEQLRPELTRVRRLAVEEARDARLQLRIAADRPARRRRTGPGPGRLRAWRRSRSDAARASADGGENAASRAAAGAAARAASRVVGRGWRRMPRTSRSSWSTRAAATRSGSREIVRASQSMYVGSKSATWPSVWPWNLPNSIGQARAASSDGGSGGRKLCWRARPIGPFGWEARSGSRRSRSVG